MAKVYIFGAAVNTGLAWLVIIGVVNSVISAYYYLRVVKAMFLSPATSDAPLAPDPPLRVALLGTAAAVLLFGIYPKVAAGPRPDRGAGPAPVLTRLTR